MSEYTKELLKRLSYVGKASHRLMDSGTCQPKGAPTQQLVLDILAEEDGVTSGVLAEILDMRPSSVTEILNKLENRGEIQRIEDEQDKRIKRIYITAIGRTKANQNKPQERSAEFFAGLTDDELETLNQLLGKMIAGWSEDFGGRPEFPNDPFEAIEALKAMKLQFDPHASEVGRMTPAQRRQLKRAWREQMRNQFGGRDFRAHGFGPGPFDPQAKPQREKPTDAPQESDWENW
ncbi:MarR family winged helix-turn-helix transcriptional regulator [Enterococcus pseudoavium]|uniref:MarR family winged helix-turn-helix transcriptional regulator n=1 Tax=Enterococcus pseudoavium TaxID=44007 RepID=A0AAE4I0T2_9ENTE|nr:MarR family winged helix-turn-helix transcriptional regulator [Enterococcus pseudoavium]MDT2735701.1 MarR family winged helix-turn-helix transcriptional regulator [Enterococcus pseudoavium]